MSNLDQASKLLSAYLTADIPAFLWGAPGVGKSDIVRAIAKSQGLALIDLRAVLLDPVDLRGIPSIENGETRWNPPQFLPNETRDGAAGILFLDELNAAPPSVQAALFQLVLDRKLGEYALPAGWRIVAAGNRQSDRAAANRMPSALANRFAHIDCEADCGAWSQWAAVSGIDPAVIAFIRFRPELLHKMDGAELRAFPTPRAWSKVSAILNAPAELLASLVSGIVGNGAAAEFIGFLAVYKSLPSLPAIFNAPDVTPVPNDPSARYALSCAIGRALTAVNIAAGIHYLERMSPEFATMGLLDAIRRDSSLKETAGFVQWAIRNQSVTL